MTRKAETNAVEQATLDSGEGEPLPGFVTKDGIDGTLLHVVKHDDSDVSIYIDFAGEKHRQVVMSPEQAKEFFTRALSLC